MPARRTLPAIDAAECGRRFRAAREAAGLTQSGAARRLGVAQQTYAQYESGRSAPTLPQAYRLIAALGLDPALIFPEFATPGEKNRGNP